jgi:hypothetical protein
VPRVVLDVVNGTGDPAVAADVTARLQAAGMTIGSVTADPAATTSGLRYPATAAADARALATALRLPAGSLQRAAVGHLTLVLGGARAGQTQALVDRVSCPA